MKRLVFSKKGRLNALLDTLAGRLSTLVFVALSAGAVVTSMNALATLRALGTVSLEQLIGGA